MVVSLERALAGAPVRVGTQNRAKLEAVRSALERFAGDEGIASPLEIVGVDVESGVAEQPRGFEEIVRGARNRAQAALASGESALGLGIEDGLVALPLAGGAGGSGSGSKEESRVFNLGCAWVTDGNRDGQGFSSGFAYPPACEEPAYRDQEPIGDLFDTLWRAHRDPDALRASGPREGNIGKLTGGRLGRAEYGSHAILCALVRFLHGDLYD